jgi:ABC-type transport system, involved in lipoprotein release, permease component
MMGVLAVSIGLALIMITVNGAFAQRLDTVRAQVGTEITVRPAGSFGGGFFRGDNGGGASPTATPAPGSSTTTTADPIITDGDLQQLTTIPHVASITRVITTRYGGTNLVSGITFGGRANATPRPGQGNGGGGGFRGGILVTGTDDPNTLASVGVQDVSLSSGRSFTGADEGTDVAVVGQTLATANNLTVGSTFVLDPSGTTTTTPTGSTTTATTAGTTMTVIGIYTTGTQFGDNSMALPIDTARTIFSRSNEVDQAIVKADSVDNVDAVSTAIKSTLGTDKADVTTALSTFSTISSPLSDAQSSSQIGMIVALIASAAIILFSIGLVARQRIREIGIMKAVGASGWNVISQFGIETGIMSIGAALLGALATFPLAQTVANGLVSSPSTPAFGGPGGAAAGVAGRGGGRFFAAAGNAAGGANGLLGTVNVAVSPEVFLYALAIAVGLALVATIVPVWYVGRVRPAEVLRHE